MPDGPSTPPPTVTITASPTSITAGTSSILTVAATNSTNVTVTGGGTSYALSVAGGTQTVSPTTTTTYTATATGPGGTATATATVTLGPAVPPTVSIAANPATITAGTSSVLTVSAANATSVTLKGNDGSSYTLEPTGGTPSVSPTTTTTYTATATGPGGTTTATATVTVTAIVNPPPTVTVTANPTSVQAGSSSILTVAATNATQVTITGGGESYNLPPTGGTQAVSPGATTTYTVTATGLGGTVTAAATVTVTPNPAPTVTLVANPGSITSGSSSTLTVNATNATQVTISGGGNTYTVQGTSGIQAVSPTATTTYTATATGPGGTATAATTVTVTANPPPTVTITANPTTVISGNASTLTVDATDATQVTVTGGGNSYSLPVTGGTQSVSPTVETVYTATVTGPGGTATATATVSVVPPGSVNSVDHVIFMLQENHTFDNYFGMLNPYRQANSTNGQAWDVGDDGKVYSVDGIEDKLTTISNPDDQGNVYPLFKFTSTCIDDETSDWLASSGDVNRYNFRTTRPILMDGFVHTAQGYSTYCASTGFCAGDFTGDPNGRRAMGYYDQNFLNYYYYMASQFAVSDRWFSPVASKSIPNRIATLTGGTTQGLVRDPGKNNDHLPQLNINNIFQELDQANVSWKIYYTVTQGNCLDLDDCPGGLAAYPATDFSYLTYSFQYLYIPKAGASCTPPTQPSSVIGDASNSFCIDTNHIAPLSTYFSDLANGTLPSFAFIEPGYGQNDEHPGSGQSVLLGQQEVAKIVNAFMLSPEWSDSVFFLSYDEGGGPYDHVPPVPGHSNDYTDVSQAPDYPDISAIAVNPDSYFPCLPTPPDTPTLHCDLQSNYPGAKPEDAVAQQGFAAQLGFRLPNMIISPFTRRHYVSHIPMDHTAILKFVENRFIGPNAHLTARDAAQSNLLDFFNFTNPPWATPPTPPTPVSLTDPLSPGRNSCQPANFGP